MSDGDVVFADELLRQRDYLAVGVGLGVPPAVLVQGAERVDEHRLPARPQRELLLAVDVDEAALASLALDNGIDLECGFEDGIELRLGEIGYLKCLLPVEEPVERLELGRDLEVWLGQFAASICVPGSKPNSSAPTWPLA